MKCPLSSEIFSWCEAPRHWLKVIGAPTPHLPLWRKTQIHKVLKYPFPAHNITTMPGWDLVIPGKGKVPQHFEKLSQQYSPEMHGLVAMVGF
jgi:hypothetical protein